jgi:Family of unknown function (DUF6518)
MVFSRSEPFPLAWLFAGSGRWARRTSVVLAGALTGFIGAYCYYDGLLRPLAHTFGIWILLVTIVSAHQSAARAVANSIVTLLAAVITFNLGKKIIYDVRYPDTTYAISVDALGMWCVLAIVAGIVLGAAFHRAGQNNWRGAGATAAAIGLLIADAARRGITYPDQAQVVGLFAILAIGTVLIWVGPMPGRQLARIMLLVAPFVALGLALVAIPDLLQALLFIAG